MSDQQDLPVKIGAYEIIRRLGKGGMGEIFLATDPVCGRQVALKKIRSDMRQNPTIQGRFLKEAKIAARLTHPNILSIYTIHHEEDLLFYTMPYIEGHTLRQIVKSCIEEQKEGNLTHPIGSSIPSLIRIFFNICEAIAYCHSKKILHRDLKLENIIIGKYGEVLILDWGLAHKMGEEIPLPTANINGPNLTKPGKIAGTLSYLAPERLLNIPPSEQTDIYSLGVILYQLLTFKTPFYRPSIQVFRKRVGKERLLSPHEVAPYRNIPPYLADIAKRCLEPDPKRRYHSVEELITDLTSYLEGKPEWLPAATLNIDRKTDWEFQENILLSKRMALTGSLDAVEWVSLMISKTPFSDNIKIETTIILKPSSNGIGFLLGIADQKERKGFEEGYCLWIGSQHKPLCKLFRSNIEVMDHPGTYLMPEKEHKIRIEKEADHLRFFLDEKCILHYISHIPLNGSHVGLLYRDADFTLSELNIFVGSQNVTVSCLAIPDAFLAHKNYTKALTEYRKIRLAFVGRLEAQEATFRAGITLLEQAKSKSAKEKKRLTSLAFEEFGLLRETPGAPLEYLGKALVYQFTKELEEEMKCLELCLRKYPKHPLLKIIIEHIVFRLHETASKERTAAFHYALLTLRLLPNTLNSEEGVHLLEALKKHLSPLPLFTPENTTTHLAISLAFYLAKPLILIDLFETHVDSSLRANICFALLALGEKKWVLEHYDLLENPIEKESLKTVLQIEESDFDLPCSFSLDTPSCKRKTAYLLDTALKKGYAKKILKEILPLKEKDLLIDSYLIKAYLLTSHFDAAKKLLLFYPEKVRSSEHSLLFPLMGGLLWHLEGKRAALAHFAQNASPPYSSTTLPSFFFKKKEKLPLAWKKTALFFEKIELFHYLEILYTCAKEMKKAKFYHMLIKKESHRV